MNGGIRMSRPAFAAIAAATLLSATPAAAATPQAAPPSRMAEPIRLDRTRIDHALAAMVASGRAAGVSALIWQGGRENYFGRAGFADREAKRPFARDTLVQIYSMTKPVTGVALMQLWEQGRFGLDDPLAHHLPDFTAMQVYHGKDSAGAPIYRPAARPILIRDILRHTAGFAYGPGDTPAEAAFAAADPLNLRNDLTEFGRRIAGLPLLFDPGDQWRYSAAVDVQALLVEKLSGEPFEQYVRRHILDPLGMGETGWTQPEERFPRLAASYSYDREKRTLTRMSKEETRRFNFNRERRLTMGGAGLVSSIDDYMRFARMLLGQGTLDGVRILKPSTVRLMATDHLDPRIRQRQWLGDKGSVGFGFDFAVRTAQPRNEAENRGAVGEFFWDGRFSTLFWVDPANDLAAVFLVQTDPFEGTLHRDFRAAVYGPDYLGRPGD
jgi:CubicO group peptidase (beta-lactamase class C family)